MSLLNNCSSTKPNGSKVYKTNRGDITKVYRKRPTLIKVGCEMVSLSDLSSSTSVSSGSTHKSNTSIRNSTVVEIDFSGNDDNEIKSKGAIGEVINLSQSEKEDAYSSSKNSNLPSPSGFSSSKRDISFSNESSTVVLTTEKQKTIHDEIDSICHNLDTWNAKLCMPCIQNNIYHQEFDIFSMCDSFYKGCNSSHIIYLDPSVYSSHNGFNGLGFKSLTNYLQGSSLENGFSMHFNGNSHKGKSPSR